MSTRYCWIVILACMLPFVSSAASSQTSDDPRSLADQKWDGASRLPGGETNAPARFATPNGYCPEQAEVQIDYAGSGLWSDVMSVAVKDNYVFCATWRGLMAYDLNSISFNPVVKLDLNHTGTIYVCVSGDYAFVSTFTGMKIYNVADPLHPVLMSEYNGGHVISQIQVIANRAYLADCWGFFDIVDISNPAAPARVGSYAVNSEGTYYETRGLAVVGDRAYFMTVVALHTLNIADEANPAPIATIDFGYSQNYSFSLDNNLAYIGAEDSVAIYDVSDFQSQLQVGRIDSIDAAMSISLRDGVAYVSTYNNGVWAYNVSNPQAPSLISKTLPGTRSGPLAFAGDKAIVPDLYSGAHIVDFSNVASPLVLNSFANHTPLDTKIVGQYALATVGKAGLDLVDISDASNPTIVTNLVIPGSTLKVELKGTLAFVLTSEGGLYTVSLSNLPNLELIGSCSLGYPALSMAVAGNFVYIGGDVYSGFFVVNVVNPSAPTVTGLLSLGHSILSIAPAGSLVYIYTYPGLMTINVSNPYNPYSLNVMYPAIWPSTDMCVSGSYLYVGLENRLQTFDISDPSSPTLLNECVPTIPDGRLLSMALQENRLYVSYDNSNGVFASNVTESANPHSAGYAQMLGSGYGIDVAGNRICVAAGQALTTFSASSFIVGDADASGGIDISDAVFLIGYIFGGGPAPSPIRSGDADCSGSIDISDVVYLIAYIFAGGAPPCSNI